MGGGELKLKRTVLTPVFWHIVLKFRKLKDTFDTKTELSDQKNKKKESYLHRVTLKFLTSIPNLTSNIETHKNLDGNF